MGHVSDAHNKDVTYSVLKISKLFLNILILLYTELLHLHLFSYTLVELHWIAMYDVALLLAKALIILFFENLLPIKQHLFLAIEFIFWLLNSGKIIVF